MGEVGAPAPGGGHAANSEIVRRGFDLLENASQILRSIVIPKSQNGYAARRQPIGSSQIATRLRLFIVLTAVELNRKPKLWAVEIKRVRPGRMLSPEAETIQPATS